MQQLTWLEPNSHKKEEILKAMTVTVSHVCHSTKEQVAEMTKRCAPSHPQDFPRETSRWSTPPLVLYQSAMGNHTRLGNAKIKSRVGIL